MQTAWRSLGNTVRTIAEEAVATAKELREAHSTDAWVDRQPVDTSIASPPHTRTTAPAAAEAGAPAGRGPPVAGGGDVAARLAALKSKLQADRARGVVQPAGTQDSAHPAAAPEPSGPVEERASQVPVPQPRSDAAAPELLLRQQLNAARQRLEDEQRAHGRAAEALRTLQARQAQEQRELQDALAAAQRDAEQLRLAAASSLSETHQIRLQLSSEKQALEALRADNSRLAAAAAAAEAAAADASAAAASTSEAELSRLEAAAQAARLEAASQRSRVDQLEAEAAQLRAQVEQMAAAAASSATSTSGAADVEAELTAARAECAALRHEVQTLQGQVASASSEPGRPATMDAAAAAEAEAEALRAALAAAEAALAAADADRASARQQLSRLKGQMLGEQEDEEEKVRWRVEAEVKLALDKAKKRGGGGDGAVEAQLRRDLEAALQRVEALQEAAAGWEAAVAARDAELSNLQRALGELSYESDAAERLRAELRAQHAECHLLRNKVDSSRLAAMAAEEALRRAEGDAAAARADAAAVRDAEAAAQRELLALRVALQDAVQRGEAASGAGAPLDRAAVLQALSAVIRARRPREGATLAAKLLELSDDERAAVEAGARQRGGGRDSLADKWISFLESQVDTDGLVEAAPGGAPHAAHAEPPPARAAVPL